LRSSPWSTPASSAATAIAELEDLGPVVPQVHVAGGDELADGSAVARRLERAREGADPVRSRRHTGPRNGEPSSRANIGSWQLRNRRGDRRPVAHAVVDQVDDAVAAPVRARRPLRVPVTRFTSTSRSTPSKWGRARSRQRPRPGAAGLVPRATVARIKPGAICAEQRQAGAGTPGAACRRRRHRSAGGRAR
jgi:hypothetical protein